MKNEFILTAIFPAQAGEIYKAWLTTQGHTLMTGSPANIDGSVKGDFSAWDGYIWGTFLELEENKKIVQTWRTSEFPEDAEDSRVEVILEETNGQTKLTVKHSNIPEGQADGYKTGWDDFYFKPMMEYFGE